MKYDAISTRDAFGRAVLDVMRADPTAVALAADTGKSMGFDGAAKEFPNRVFNTGIAEQNMVNMAAGLAAVGKRVFIGTYAPFLTLRAAEQIRTFLCYPNLPVKMAGAMGGLSGGIEGVTHQGIEDIAVMRALPNMSVVVPADAVAAYKITVAVAQLDSPVYIRLGRYVMPSVFGDDYRFEYGKANLLADGSDLTLICCGCMVERCLRANEKLRGMGINARVLEMPTIKPLDAEAVARAAAETGAIVTAEEHSVIGGLGSAVTEAVAELCPVPVERVGVNDRFAESAGQEELMDAYGLSVDDVIGKALKAKGRKEA